MFQPGDSGVVIGYQIDEFTYTWYAEWFVVHSHIYPWFTGKMSLLIHFPLEPGCEDCSFLDPAISDFEQGLESILTDAIKTLELHTSLMSLMSLLLQSLQGFLHSITALSDASK